MMATAGRVDGLDGWKKVADTLNRAADQLRPAGMRTGYHNHQAEFKPLEGRRPIEVLAANTTPDVMLQLDVGTCIEAGSDPVAWVEQNPGRIRLRDPKRKLHPRTDVPLEQEALAEPCERRIRAGDAVAFIWSECICSFKNRSWPPM